MALNLRIIEILDNAVNLIPDSLAFGYKPECLDLLVSG
jgi:hypothetical protein